MINPITLRRTCNLKNIFVPNVRQLNLSRFMSSLSSENFEKEIPVPLIGPPEIYIPTPESPPKPKKKTQKASDSFMGLMVSDYNKTMVFPSNRYCAPNPYMGFTENNSPTFLSSGNQCLDFFFHVVPDTPPDQVATRLQSAWDEDPLTALKLVCNLRGIRGTGKGDRDGFYAAALWLHENHPKTLAFNASTVVEFGYFKDLLEILYRLLEGPTARKTTKKVKQISPFFQRNDKKHLYRGKRVTEKQRIEAGKKGLEKYTSDPVYRFLHNQVSLTFAEALKEDLKNMKDGDFKNISLAAKWCPSLYSFYDRSTLLCEAIARRLFPKESCPEYEGIEEAHYAYRIRDRLRKEVLVPLRKYKKIPEIFMSAKEWDLVPYNFVPSVAMKNYRDVFMVHDKERFKGFLEKVKKGKAKIAAGALLPHEIIASLKENMYNSNSHHNSGYSNDNYYENSDADDDDNNGQNNVLDDGKRDANADGVDDGKSDANDDGVDANEVLELQWKRMVDDLKEIGKLNNCLAICDVSGSMRGTPLEVSVALGLLISDLSEDPWKGKLITFSNNPQLQIIEGDSLLSKVNSIERMDWEMITDFQLVFDKILEVAKNGKLREEQMVKRLFVFSDMEFDEASASPWETDYEAICRKFEENGYKSVPEIVFWNLRNSKATPVPSHQKGVALVSGFSKNLIKLFLREGGVTSPMLVMEKAIASDEYKKLVVVD